MRALEVISINFGQILISLLNLLLLFLILKRFLYAPVKSVVKDRQEMLKRQFDEAENAVSKAKINEEYWNGKIKNAQQEANSIIKNAMDNANQNSKEIISDAKKKARDIVTQAEINAKIERKKAENSIKKEIADASTILAEKIISREINEYEQKNLIDNFIKEMENMNE